ncbi:MbtH family protein [Mycetocola reblochoni]|uniref:MbtH protein n=2 Tax=Mycetocola reblochoni TaxID=331618 RepID=A0A1R4ID11_9MICO|nr:MbtH family protein [Mycetocola reblochoni]RLP69130.1 MbtH family protein [Mycetocola reblochoni]SJN17474.1 MbtH protein [Mycetocola reblochoni REB411]
MNPFDDQTGTFLALVNPAGQHSLWPEFAPVPGGWTVVHGPGARDEVLAWIDDNWADITPVVDA